MNAKNPRDCSTKNHADHISRAFIPPCYQLAKLGANILNILLGFTIGLLLSVQTFSDLN